MGVCVWAGYVESTVPYSNSCTVEQKFTCVHTASQIPYKYITLNTNTHAYLHNTVEPVFMAT